MATIAWRIAEPPPGGTQVIEISSDFDVVARYSANRAEPDVLSCQTPPLSFAEVTACFRIDAAPQVGMACGAVLTQRFDGLVLNQVRVANNYGVGCEVNLCKDGNPIYLPQVVWPGGLWLEDLRSPLYVAVVPQFTYAGQRLVLEEIGLTQVEVLDGSVVTIVGSLWKGYVLTVG